ncbi:unnamed protein product [Camellia sinensis]
MEDKIQHFIHEHPLLLKQVDPGECLVCRNEISIGTSAYSCREHFCFPSYNIHIPCAKLQREMVHSFHPKHSITFQMTLPNAASSSVVSFKCNACGPIPRSSNYFHCYDCGFNLDPCCASLKPTKPRNVQDRQIQSLLRHPHPLATHPWKLDLCLPRVQLLAGRINAPNGLPRSIILFIRNTRSPCSSTTISILLPIGAALVGSCWWALPSTVLTIQQLSHPHPLIPCEMMKKGYTITCDACQLHFEEDSSVVYVCLECKFLLHKSCADLPLKSEDPFVKEKPYIRPISSGKANEFKGELKCHACTNYASGFAYVCCNPKCGIFFDIRCPVSKPWFIKSEIHQHPIPFFNDRPSWLYCTVCNRMINITPFFRCVQCEFNLHPYCVPKLPPTAKDKIHRHPLTLTESPIRDYPDEDVYSEFYCDACEEMRYLDEPTYYCEECHYVAHVHCLLPEVFPMLGAYKFGETKLDMSSSTALMIEDMVEEEEGLDEQESHAGADQVDMGTSSSGKGFPSVSTDDEITARGVSSMVASKKMEGPRKQRILAGDDTQEGREFKHRRGSFHFNYQQPCKAFIREREMENQIKHFIHEHPLRMEKGVLDDECFCLLCHKDIASPMYSCCNEFCLRKVYMHKSCAQFPQVMLHPFHPHTLTLLIRPRNEIEYFDCDACWRTGRTHSNYHCFKCDFNLDICCASLMPAKILVHQKNQSQIQHHTLRHPHPLIVCNNNDTILFNFTCSFCKLPINGSRIYVCLYCKCLLDQSCAEWPSQIEHPCHRKHPLTLLDQRWNTFSRQCRACGKVLEKGILFKCDDCRVRNDQRVDSSRCSACGKFLTEGFSFNCSECNFSLDPLCASLIPLPSSTQNSQGSSRDDEFQIQQLRHPHPLILCEKKKDYRISCDACQLHFEDDDSIVYICLECKFLLHKSCADLPLQVKSSFCHHQHTLTLLQYSLGQLCENSLREENIGDANEFSGKFKCHACQVYASGFAYVCTKCAIFFDIKCPISKPFLISSQLQHEHPLALFSAIPYLLYCNACNRQICTYFFRCVECEFNLHVGCVTTLPPTVKDKYHRHPLTLTNSPIKDHPDENEYSEFICDSCEERRELYDPTYYCEECHYVAHVHCQLSEIFPILEEQFLPCKLGETKLEMSASVCEDGNGIGDCKDLMIEEILGKERDEMESQKRFRGPYGEVFSDVSTDDETEGTRTAEQSSLTELDEVEWLTTRLKATKKRLKELEERRAQYVASLSPNLGDNE